MNGVIAGRIVHYVLSEGDADKVNTMHGVDTEFGFSTGYQRHVGSKMEAGEHVPAMIVKICSDEGMVNLQCLLDGNDSLWVTSCRYSEKPESGLWHWMERA